MISQIFSHYQLGGKCIIFLVGLLLILSPALAAKEEQLELQWNELGQAVSGRKVIVALTDGEIIEGQILDVGSDDLRIDVKETSNPQDYPKGLNSVRRSLVSVVRLKEVRGNWRAIGTAIGLGVTVPLGIGFAQYGANESNPELGATIAAVLIGGGVAAGYFGGRAADRRVVVITIVPD